MTTPNQHMQPSDLLIDFLKREEDFRATAYEDGKREGVQLYSIGFGHQIGADEAQLRTASLSEADAERYLMEDMHDAVVAVQNAVTVPLTQGQFDALVSFTYNVGVGSKVRDTGFLGSTLLEKINDGDMEAAQKEFARWTFSGGEKSNGLILRRAREAALFASDYDFDTVSGDTSRYNEFLASAEKDISRHGINPHAEEGNIGEAILGIFMALVALFTGQLNHESPQQTRDVDVDEVEVNTTLVASNDTSQARAYG